MEKFELALLRLLRDALQGEKPEDPELSAGEWSQLLRLAERHKLLPILLDAASAIPSYRTASRNPASVGRPDPRPPQAPAPGHSELSAAEPKNPSSSPRPSETTDGERIATASVPTGFAMTEKTDCHGSVREPRNDKERAGKNSDPDWKHMVLEQVSRQALQENEFLNLILFLRERGLEPVVMKGALCRALYPRPLLRPSVDDDVLIPADQGPAYHQALLDFGMTADDPDMDPDAAWELSYHKPNSPLYVEAHKVLFDPESDSFTGFNEPFQGALDRAVRAQIQDVELLTLEPTDHLLFLILHAFKHFLHSGFGLRIVTDICLFTWRHGDRVDFSRIHEICAKLRCDAFVAAVYRIGERFFDLPIPEQFVMENLDIGPILADILASGLHGAEIDRLHSANITLRAVSDRNQGRVPAASGLRATVFPSAEKLSGRYPYLQTRPWLLPVAWVSRLGSYFRTRRQYGEQNPVESLRIGKERVELLREYSIIPKD